MLVRRGELVRLGRDRETGTELHTLPLVYTEMLRQICMDYPSLPDIRTITLAEIRFFYNGIKGQLMKHTKPASQSQTKTTPRSKRAR